MCTFRKSHSLCCVCVAWIRKSLWDGCAEEEMRENWSERVVVDWEYCGVGGV